MMLKIGSISSDVFLSAFASFLSLSTFPRFLFVPPHIVNRPFLSSWLPRAAALLFELSLIYRCHTFCQFSPEFSYSFFPLPRQRASFHLFHFPRFPLSTLNIVSFDCAFEVCPNFFLQEFFHALIYDLLSFIAFPFPSSPLVSPP